jgi:hypothetical protein
MTVKVRTLVALQCNLTKEKKFVCVLNGCLPLHVLRFCIVMSLPCMCYVLMVNLGEGRRAESTTMPM